MDDQGAKPPAEPVVKLVSFPDIEREVATEPPPGEPDPVYFVDLEEAVKGVFDTAAVRNIVGGVAKQIAHAIDERRVLDSQADPSIAVLEPRIPLRRESRQMLAESGGLLLERPSGFDSAGTATRDTTGASTETAKEAILSSFVRDLLA